MTLFADDYAVPGKRALRIHDASAVRFAWDHMHATKGLTPDERKEARQSCHIFGLEFAVIKPRVSFVSSCRLDYAMCLFVGARTVKRELWAAALVLLLTQGIASAGSDEIEHACTVQYPNVWQYFAWKDCVKTDTQREEEANLKRVRDEQAHPCNISRMEELATKARDAAGHRSLALWLLGYPEVLPGALSRRLLRRPC
jgi:hypothetical protein